MQARRGSKGLQCRISPAWLPLLAETHPLFEHVEDPMSCRSCGQCDPGVTFQFPIQTGRVQSVDTS